MKLGTRLWLWGALVPSMVMLLALLVAGQLFRAALESSLDRGLMAQAAAESVSLFDRADGPHLHMAESPLLHEIRHFAPTGELFDSNGILVAHFPPMPHPEHSEPPPSTVGPRTELLTWLHEGTRRRDMVVRMKAGDGQDYVLRLSASLAQVDESVRTFYAVAFSVVAVAGLLLLGLQRLVAMRLARRLGALSAHLDLIRGGQLDQSPPADLGQDEIAALREVLAATTRELKGARAAQERLVADAAHELRTPLTLMRTTLDLALRRERSADELRQALLDARAEVDRLARLATALLDMATVGSAAELSLGDLAGVVEEAADAARASAEERGVWLEVKAEKPALALLNGAALRQALDNIISNALRFAPKGTPIVISLVGEAQKWMLSVRDFGPGIPAESRQDIFAPFHRMDVLGGAGLGLAIVREVMRHHRGTVAAAAPDGAGALLVLEFPRVS